jgi:hypothetical protein
LISEKAGDNQYDEAEQEGNAPTPVQQLLFRQRRDRDEHQGGEDGAGLGPAQGPAGEERPIAGGGVFERQRVGSGLLTGGGKSLQQPQQGQQHGRHAADGPRIGQQSDRQRRPTHQHQREKQHRLAADAIAKMPQDNGADRACDIADAEAEQGQQRAGRRIDIGEEYAWKYQRGRGAVDEEIIVFEHAAEKADHRSPARQPLLAR